LVFTNSYRKVPETINFLYYYYLHIFIVAVVINSSVNAVVLNDNS